jgi:hypothetical protein
LNTFEEVGDFQSEFALEFKSWEVWYGLSNLIVDRARFASWIVYFWAWSKKTIQNCNKVSAIRMLVLDPYGEIALDDDEEKTVAIFPGRMTSRRMREAVRSFAEFELRRKNPDLKIPLRNVVPRSPEEIDKILGKSRPDLKALR